jgi:hypothetical protein
MGIAGRHLPTHLPALQEHRDPKNRSRLSYMDHMELKKSLSTEGLRNVQHVQPKPAACSSVSIRLPKVHIWPSWSREKIVPTSWLCDKVEFTRCRKELSSSNVIATVREPLRSSCSDEI